MTDYYEASVSPNMTLTLTEATNPCTYTGTRCVNKLEYVCISGVETADGKTCGGSIIPGIDNNLILLGGVAALVIVGVALLASGPKRQ